jgi:hypothetical protein
MEKRFNLDEPMPAKPTTMVDRPIWKHLYADFINKFHPFEITTDKIPPTPLETQEPKGETSKLSKLIHPDNGYAAWFYVEMFHDKIKNPTSRQDNTAEFAKCYPDDFHEKARVPADVMEVLKWDIQYNPDFHTGRVGTRYIGMYASANPKGANENGVFIAWDRRQEKLVRLVDAEGFPYFKTRIDRGPITIEDESEIENVPVECEMDEKYAMVAPCDVFDLYSENCNGGTIIIPAKVSADDLQRRFWIVYFNRVFNCAWWHHPQMSDKIVA